ncbi:H/ACA ribonucleoprotein complex subunit 1-like [Mytilus trossulus]|uniref:H/ACA ribonucleoprotein complex subunit 1-like n=1 Tax=Mytilus trossulus TaxID=6551 RepID=UPI00300664D8
MGFERGGGRGGGRGFGGGRGGGFRGGRGGGGRGGGGGRFQQDYGPPEYVVEIGTMEHTCEDDLVCLNTNEKVPYFNAPVYLENKQQIGKVDEIFGSITESYFSVKLSDDMKAKSFAKLSKFFIDPAKLLPLQRFLPKPAGSAGKTRGGGGRGGGRGGGGFRGGRGGGGRGGGGFGGGRGGGGFGGGRGGGFRGGRGGGGGGFRGRGGGGFRGGRGN